MIDVDEWARVFALQSLTGAADVYTRGGLHHNINFYVRPSDNRVLALPWDWDFAFTASTSDALIGSTGRAGRLLTRPGFRRFVYGHLLDIINTTFNNEYLDPWIVHYGQVAGQNLSPIRSFVSARSRYVLSRLPAEIPFEITTQDGADFSVDTSTVTLNGRGWVNVHKIRRAGTTQDLAVRWLDDESWQLDVALAGGDNTITLEAIDHQGQVVGTDSLTVTSSVPNPVPQSLRITEMDYNPAAPTADELDQIPSLNNDDFEFLEVQNIGDLPINLLNVRFDVGIAFTFPDAILQTGEMAVIVQNTAAFQLRYGVDVRVLGEFADGKLSNSGEQLRLRAADGTVLLDFEYGDQNPWPELADGGGGTLALIDVQNTPPDQYGNPARWTAGPATPGQANTIAGDLNGDGHVTADDIDFLCAAIHRGDAYYDLNGDGELGRADLTFFVQDVLHTSIGDANVDGVFNSSDFVIVFQVGEYEDGIVGNSTWAEGDWNCDGDFNSSDFVAAFQAGGYVATARSAALSAPTAGWSDEDPTMPRPPQPLVTIAVPPPTRPRQPSRLELQAVDSVFEMLDPLDTSLLTLAWKGFSGNTTGGDL